nr:recombinase family protein [Clostridium acidisoli]
MPNNPDYESAAVFSDRSITGTTNNRPEFQRILEICRNKKIDLIITKSISRFARNTTIVLETTRNLKDIGVEVRFEKENIETMSGYGELMLAVLSSFAQEESKNVSDNLKWRARKKFEQEEFIKTTLMAKVQIGLQWNLRLKEFLIGIENQSGMKAA